MGVAGKLWASSLTLLVAAVGWAGSDGTSWPTYNGDLGSTKYAPLDQINKDNVSQLTLAWQWDSPENALAAKDRRLMTFAHEATPLMADGVLYTLTSHCVAAAMDAATGETQWTYDPESYKAGRPTNLGFLARGLAYWTDGSVKRLFVPTGDSRLIAVDAVSGKPVPEFGVNGEIDLTQGLRRPIARNDYTVNSPPIVCRDVVVVGSAIFDGPSYMEMPPGDVRGFDARTGALKWTFQTVPQPGEFGNETWENGSWQYTGNTNVWTLMSADDALGFVYLPTGTPTNDWYGGHRHGDGLFGESLVCLNVETGERVWHFQHVHHGVWDYDLPAAPVLADIVVDGTPRKALAQITKQGFCWMLDRVTGEPIWPIEERPVPQSTVSGEKTSPTQPFPTKPVAFIEQGASVDSLIDFTPEVREKALAIFEKYHGGPLYTPPGTDKPTINMPGWAGAANWNGAALDPETATLFIPVKRAAISMLLVKPDAARSNFDYVGRPELYVQGPEGLPLWKPPYSYVIALNMNTGEYTWKTTTGAGPKDHPLLKGLNLPDLGDLGKGFPLATRSLLFLAMEDENKMFYALDKGTGEILFKMALPVTPTGAPLTYMQNGKQFIVLAGGGRREPASIMALALP
ncbi:MAG: PQQ-binding-like beta-propeller repeat protein [Candidatus Hydrogenedentes bacterium]|nr:PQQ-binding-like beta-propeller repeat protein [Candidatus Hydrogenedentota bacterium]